MTDNNLLSNKRQVYKVWPLDIEPLLRKLHLRRIRRIH